MTPSSGPLTTDLYELNMIQAYLDHGEDSSAVFEFFVRRLPARRGFLLAAGLDDALDYLETLRFSKADIDWQSFGLPRSLPLHRRRARHS
jgi:nicotinate phosphoribosyltransferase